MFSNIYSINKHLSRAYYVLNLMLSSGNMQWSDVCPPTYPSNSYIEVLTPNMILLGGGIKIWYYYKLPKELTFGLLSVIKIGKS